MSDFDDIMAAIGITTQIDAGPTVADTAVDTTLVTQAIPPSPSSEDTAASDSGVLDDILQEYGLEDFEEGNEEVEEEEDTTEDSEEVAEPDSDTDEYTEGEDITDFEEDVQEEPESSEEEVASIPENSSTLLMNDATSRFSGAEWFNSMQNIRCTIAGLGGIGSWLAVQVARLGVYRIVLYDGDRVEEGNMSGQFYTYNDVGRNKVSALRDKIRGLSRTSIYAIDTMFDSDSGADQVMLCGFDNMDARRMYYRVWKDFATSVTTRHRPEYLFIDGRLTMSELQVFCIRGDDTYNMQRYENEFLFSSEEAEHTVCSMKQTSYLASMIGSIMTNLLVNYVANLNDPVIPYDMPFFTYYDAQNMIFRTEN